MVKVDEAFTLRYKNNGKNFEVLVDFHKLNDFKKNSEDISVYDVTADDKIFSDQKKGLIASETEIKSIFGEKSDEEILKEILLKGECQIPTSFLNSMRDEKKKQIINYISENATNPQTKSKYTPTMIESEVDKLKYNYNPDRDYLIQANEVLSLLKKVMPIAITKVIIQIKIPGEHCGNFYGEFRKFGKPSKDFYDDHGNLNLELEINESIVDEIIGFIKKNSNETAEYLVKEKN